MRKLTCFIVSFVCVTSLMVSCAAPQGDFQCSIREDGTLESLVYDSMSVPFFSSGHGAGPVFYISDGETKSICSWNRNPDGTFAGSLSDVLAHLEYDVSGDYLKYTITLKNTSDKIFAPDKAGIALGIDTDMAEYPSWLTKFFPTLLKNEASHFYGYLQSPEGNILGIASADPIASWSLDYNLSYYDIPEYWFYGHKIESVNLDFINAGLSSLSPGEERQWTISLFPVDNLQVFEETVSSVMRLPMLDVPRTSFSAGETATFDVLAVGKEMPEIKIKYDDGSDCPHEIDRMSSMSGRSMWRVNADLHAPGQYDVQVNNGGYCSTAVLLVHDTWENVIRNARAAALENNQKPSSHVESWYGFHSAFIAAAHFPDPVYDRQLDKRFDVIFDKVFDREQGQPRIYKARIQNTSSTIGMLVDRYQAYGRIEDLKLASRMADWLIGYSQDACGAYMSGHVKYTSVIYVAKSLIELYLVEKELGAKSSEWCEASQRHYDSIAKAIDELVLSQGDFETEGEMTFEDGMVSCSALQVGLFALLQEDSQKRDYYRDAMLKILDSHDCLVQHKVPDGRRRGGTMRFWEAQYDVLMLPNMICSPHGWSAWRAYASYYAYLLTLDEKYLIETFNVAGALANLIDVHTGKLRWAFIVDPYLKVRQIASPVEGVDFDDLTTGNPHPEIYGTVNSVIGEQYVDMISSWQPVNSQDNDVHEAFKFIAESVLTRAFVVERSDGTVVGYNCDVVKEGRTLTVIPSEPQITDVHLNLKSEYKIKLN